MSMWQKICSISPKSHTSPMMLYEIRHVNVKNCLLIIIKYQPISLQCSWLGVEQPIRIDWVFYGYKHHWEFPTSKKIIRVLTCPINWQILSVNMAVTHYFLASTAAVFGKVWWEERRSFEDNCWVMFDDRGLPSAFIPHQQPYLKKQSFFWRLCESETTRMQEEPNIMF